MRNTILKSALLALALLLLAGCNKAEAPPEADPGTPVEVQSVTRGNISTEHKLSGTVAADKSEQIYVSLSARCSEVYVAAGDSVSAGQALCKLDLKSFHDNYEIAQMSHQNAVKSRNDQESLLNQQVEQQERNYQSTLSLFELGAASQLEVDGAKLSLDSARISRSASIAQLDLTVKNAQKGMDQITDTLKNVRSDGIIAAPMNGTVVSIAVGKDSFVNAGMPVAVIESSDSMKIQLGVSEGLISKLRVGERAQVQIKAASASFETTILDVSSSPNPSTRLYTVQLSIPRGQVKLLSGMFADCTLYTDSRADVILVPTEALLLQEDGQYVVLLNADNTARRVLVETGLMGEGITEITAGLSGGETLVAVGQSYLKDGDLARVVSPAAAQE